jgi:paraquat-inducible protein B
MNLDAKTSSFIGDFVVNNAKSIVMCVAFAVGLYMQHQANNMKIEQLQSQLVAINARLEQQYTKLDNVKLDKAVFEATMRQFSEMSTDIRSIREQLEADLRDRDINYVEKR